MFWRALAPPVIFSEDSFPEIFSETKHRNTPRIPVRFSSFKKNIRILFHIASIFFKNLLSQKTKIHTESFVGIHRLKKTDFLEKNKNKNRFSFLAPLADNPIAATMTSFCVEYNYSTCRDKDCTRNVCAICFGPHPAKKHTKPRGGSLTTDVTPRESLWFFGGWNNPALMANGRLNALQYGNRCPPRSSE